MRLPMVIFIATFILIVGGSIAYERMLWNECRTDHSWFYCVRILGAK
jgi:hypothetical protein